MRTTQQQYQNNRLINGYDYLNQAWVINGAYMRCGHPEEMDCGCYGREHTGEQTQAGVDMGDGYQQGYNI